MRGEKIGLRARRDSDVPVLHTQLHEDVPMRVRTGDRPWQPIAADSPHSPFVVPELSDAHASFSVEELASGELAGAASLWSIDAYNRSAHLGISLLPAFRSRGLGTDVVRALCEYGFAVRNLRRLQLETLADNAAMIATATRTGFRHEGTLRRSAWVYGQELDEVVYGLLIEEWTPRS